VATRSKCKKIMKSGQLGQTKRKSKLYRFDCWIHQLVVTYVYIDSMMQLFDTDTGKSFQNKLNLKL
jgi:hypothetical protein